MRDKVFISYRRGDSDVITQKLYADFKSRYGEDRIYFDLVGSKIGFDFGQRIVNALNESAVILVIIGPAWTESFRRGAKGTDWVQFEVANALKLDAAWRVIPVLGEAKMPAAEELPAPVAQIATLQAVQLSRKANEWGPGVRVLHQEIDKRGVKRLPPYINPSKKLVRLQHHAHHFLASANQTGEALVHALNTWGYNILEQNEDEGSVSFHWGARDHVAGRTVHWLYERMHKEGTHAIIERDTSGSVLNLSMPSARYLTAGAAGLVGAVGGPPGALVYGALGIAPTAAWERRVVRRFFNGIERRLNGLDPGPDPLIFFDKRHLSIEAWVQTRLEKFGRTLRY